MDFLRKNLFFVILLACLVLAVAALGVVNMSPNADIERELQKRQKVLNDLTRLGRQLAVNAQTLEDKKAWVEQIRKRAQEVQDATCRWNRGNYEVLEVVLPDGRKFRAFPVDKAQYASESLMGEFTRKYVASYDALIQSLRPTVPASEAEIKAAIDAARDQLVRETTIDRTKLEQAAEQQGKSTRMIARAREGNLYFVPNDDPALGRGQVFATPTLLAGFDELWRAQLNLWVTMDLVEAIREVNGAALKALPPPSNPPDPVERNLLSLPIKRLEAIDIDKDYYTAPRPQEGGASPRGAKQPLLPGLTLTTRTCCPMYDVLHYSVTVVMSDGALLKLLDQLMRRTNHTILKIEMVPFDEGASDSRTFYYYGTQPVIKVKIRGEVLLLAAWQRGTWDAEKKSWSPESPPLIPVEALRAIAARSPEALRPEDAQRIR